MMLITASKEFDNEDPLLVTDPYWEMISIFRYQPILVSRLGQSHVACEIVYRIGTVEVLRRNGPAAYRFRYGQSMISHGSRTTSISLALELFDSKGSLIIAESITDVVACDDNNRRTLWTFGLTEGQSILIDKSRSELSGAIYWEDCKV